MCGIAAVLLGPDRARLGNDETRALLEPMTRALEHRGPDGEAFFYGERAALGHRRLAILDLVTGDQPMASADGRIQVCFNGEIYNHKELRRELEGRGHRFRTRSDTEVLVHGFLEWGEALPARLSGMFAFFAHDTTSGRTLCARDPLGKKPLYYTLRDGLLLLASEVKAFLALPGMPRRIDGKALRELLALRYVPGPGTLLEGYFELPPGTQALHEPGQEIRPRTYWTPGFDRASGGTPGEAARELRELFARCVTDRLEADVPLGAFLSGGVDSSGVVAAMSRSSPVKAVTVGFAESAYDELPHARAFASRFALELHEEVLRPAPVDDLWHLAGIFDLPLTDSSIWPTWLVCKAARRHVKVALSGDGADENFAGYRRYRFDLLEQRLRRFVSGGLARLLARVLPKGDWLPRPLRLKRTLENLTHDPATAYFRSVSALLPEEVDAMLLPEVGEGADPFEKLREVYEQSAAREHSARILELDQRTYLPGDILTKVDRCSMAASLEVRCPMLDLRIVDLAAALPMHYKLDTRRGKKVLKDALLPWLGRELLERPKQGFSIPLSEWLKGSLQALRDAALSGDFAESYLNRQSLARFAEEHDSGRRDRSEALWAVLVLHLWYEQWGRST